MQPIGQLPHQKWLEHPSTVRVIEALVAGGKPARFVGGCVRDAILHRPIADIDIATPEPPERSQYLLEDAGIRVIPVGLSHGAIMAVIGDMSYHITTLRRDVETYGRKALVDYVDDWQEDARRRDFTMNALYVDLDRTLYDPCGGIEDIKNGRVRFIGEPEKRIQEDYLRILRFFRFQAYYGTDAPEEEDLLACRKAASHIKLLSKERIWYEFRRLLLADDPLQVIMWMSEYDILNTIFSFKINDEVISKHFQSLIKLESQFNAPKSSLRRLACILDGSVHHAQRIREDLPVPTDDQQTLIKLSKLINDKPDLENDYQLHRLLYTYGTNIFYDYILLLAAREGIDAQSKLNVLVNWTSPKLPLQGKDLLELGFSAGPSMGILLEALTEWWLINKCQPSKQECIDWVLKHS